MSALAPATFTILDLGTARTTLLQARIVEGLLEYAGHVTVPSQGTRKGAVVSVPAAAAAIQAGAAELERMTGEPVERVFLSLTGAHVRGLGSEASVALTSRSREVTRDDVRQVLELARAISMPEDREILHIIPQEFTLDRQGGIHEPIGMLASRLDARVYAITAAAGAKDNLVLAANRAGLEVEEVIFAPLAVAEACLRAEDRHAGVAILEMGAGSTGILAFAHGYLRHAGMISIGGDHFTNDIAAGLHTPQPEAERIKRNFGAVTAGYAGASSEFEVPSLGDRPPRLMPHRELCECIEPRARELVHMIHAELAKAGALGAGLVLSGGAARLNGFKEMLEASLGRPTRFANLALIEGMPDELAELEYGFTVGACYYAHRRVARRLRPPTVWEKLRQRWSALAE